MGTLLKEIPGLSEKLAEAGRKEDALRDLPFIGAELEICGILVKQFTLRHFVLLDAAQSPFLVGGVPKPEDVAVFLWVVSPKFSTWDHAARDAFIQDVAGVIFDEAVAAITQYLDEAFLDRPEAGGTSSDPITGFAAALIDRIAEAYGWTEEVILRMPFAALFQYLRLIRRRENPRAPFINRLRDRAKRESVQAFLQAQKPKPKRKREVKK